MTIFGKARYRKPEPDTALPYATDHWRHAPEDTRSAAIDSVGPPPDRRACPTNNEERRLTRSAAELRHIGTLGGLPDDPGTAAAAP